jgi:hypothetical protein
MFYYYIVKIINISSKINTKNTTPYNNALDKKAKNNILSAIYLGLFVNQNNLDQSSKV